MVFQDHEYWSLDETRNHSFFFLQSGKTISSPNGRQILQERQVTRLVYPTIS